MIMEYQIPDIKQLNKAQIELMKLFARHPNEPESYWEELRLLFIERLALKIQDDVKKVAEEKGWTDEDFERMLHEHPKNENRLNETFH
jgi:hypothetical protein